MVLQTSRVGVLAGRVAVTAALAAATVSWAACNKVPLLAPSGTVITLYSGSTVLSLQGATDVTAVLIENGQTATTGTGGSTTATTGAGTAVQDGTVVDFTTTLGTISPAEAKTSGGQVTVHLSAGATSGTATVTAYSGGASKTLTVTIGAAAVSSLTVSANPSGLPVTGGTAKISALALDANGNSVPNIPVAFSSTAGTLSAASATTDGSGVASVTLTTSASSGATQITVTGAAGAKTGTATVAINTAAGATVSVTPPSTAAVSTPATFTIATTATSAGGTASSVTDAVIDFGDGATQDLGAVSASTQVQHVYGSSQIYRVTVTVTTSDGVTQSGSTSVAVAPLTATVTASPSTISANSPVTFTAAVPNGAWIDHYEWNFGDGGTDVTGGNTDSHAYGNQGVYHVTVTVVPKYGDPLPPASTTVTVGPG